MEQSGLPATYARGAALEPSQDPSDGSCPNLKSTPHPSPRLIYNGQAGAKGVEAMRQAWYSQLKGLAKEAAGYALKGEVSPV